MGKSSSSDKNGLKKGPWTADEDQKLVDYIQKHGHGRWRTLPKNAGLKRCGKSCRLRWTNYLRPDIKRGKFTAEEEDTIIQLHSVLGNKWSAIAARLPGRTDNEIKNYWNTHIKKKLLRMGIDPVTHNPRLDFLQLYSFLNSSLPHPSNQFSINPNLLGIGSMLNPNILNNLAASLLSTQGNNDLMNQLDGTQAQTQFPRLEPSRNPDQFQYVPGSGDHDRCLNETQSMEAKSGQLFHNPITNFGYRSNGESKVQNCHCQENTDICQAILDAPFENIANLSFGSLLSNQSSATTPLHSSSMTCFNGGAEDERDSYCSNTLMFDVPNRLGVVSNNGGFM